MTRDEANIACGNLLSIADRGINPTRRVDMIVEAFVRLGMLKLDEEDTAQSAVQRLLNVCSGIPYLATMINETLARAGLKIVKA